MLKIKVKGTEYKIRFGYKVLCDSDLIDKVIKTFSGKTKDFDVRNMLDVVAEMLLAGLQKYHSDDFGCEKLGYENAKGKVYELMDDYEDESTDEKPQDCFDLFKAVQDELFENGFFKKIQREAEKEKKA